MHPLDVIVLVWVAFAVPFAVVVGRVIAGAGRLARVPRQREAEGGAMARGKKAWERYEGRIADVELAHALALIGDHGRTWGTGPDGRLLTREELRVRSHDREFVAAWRARYEELRAVVDVEYQRSSGERRAEAGWAAIEAVAAGVHVDAS